MRPRLRDGMTTGQAISAIFETYAEKQGKPRWGDKTPLYMQHLPLLERLFPDALWVHLVRDGRDAALSFLALPPGFSGKTWAQPRTVAQFAARWKAEIDAAPRLGAHAGERCLELRYEDLVVDPARELGRICECASLAWEPAMVEYAGKVEVSKLPQHQRLAQPPTRTSATGATRCLPRTRAHSSRSAGDVLARPDTSCSSRRALPDSGGRRELARFRRSASSWNATAAAYQRSPLWRR